jgi:hypothetical protein
VLDVHRQDDVTGSQLSDKKKKLKNSSVSVPDPDPGGQKLPTKTEKS